MLSQPPLLIYSEHLSWFPDLQKTLLSHISALSLKDS